MRIPVGVLALLAVLTGPASASDAIRVALQESVRLTEVRGTDIEISALPAGAPGELDRCGDCARWRADVVRAVWAGSAIEIAGQRAAAVRLRSERPMRLGGREYGPVVDLMTNGEGIAVVNELPLEEYLAGVVRAELGEAWPLEALRAQAIVARTYAAYRRIISAGRPYHITASTAHQQYAGRVPPSSPIWGAVRETAGQVLRWEGELFPAFYHTESGGYTEDPRTVFAARNMPALKPVVCQFSAGSPHFYWTLDLRLAQLSELLRRHGTDVGTVRAIEVTERTPSLRATLVSVRGTHGVVRLRGNDFRRIVGYDTLKSTLFAVAVDRELARFTGRGYGHGVGLCQWGAKGMAEQGYPARKILEFYYPGATLGLLDGR
ncbi:MAG TPA: SpoIID/LytB domain-containing protein [Methylomirabilota bacterium]|nr:SpoIID/LytB domain-containing protein [Methylomirabilota bacterium]